MISEITYSRGNSSAQIRNCVLHIFAVCLQHNLLRSTLLIRLRWFDNRHIESFKEKLHLLWCVSSVFHLIDLVFLLHQLDLSIDGWTIFLDCSKKIWRDGKWGCDRYRKVSVRSGSSPWTILILLPHWSASRQEKIETLKKLLTQFNAW